MACPHCEEERSNQQKFCRHCFEIFPRPGAMGRLRRALGFAARKGSRDGDVVVQRSESKIFEIYDPQTGQVHHYSDPSELPEPVREVLKEAALQEAAATETRVEAHEEFRVSDGTGKERVYQSLDEMPPEIRSLFRKARGRCR